MDNYVGLTSDISGCCDELISDTKAGCGPVEQAGRTRRLILARCCHPEKPSWRVDESAVHLSETDFRDHSVASETGIANIRFGLDVAGLSGGRGSRGVRSLARLKWARPATLVLWAGKSQIGESSQTRVDHWTRVR